MAVPVDRGVTPAGVTPGVRRQDWLMEARGLFYRREWLGLTGPVNKWHACIGSYNKHINFKKVCNIGTIKHECVGRAMLGVEVIALGDGTLVDR